MSNIHGLHNNRNDNDDDDKKGNELYTGGKESGTAVLGPPGSGASRDMMQAAVNLAQNQGAGCVAHQHVPGNCVVWRYSSRGGGGKAAGGTVKVTFYRNGFTVDDGPFRAKDDPANETFLKSITQGYVPEEIRQANGGQDVEMGLVDKRSEDYAAPPAPAYDAFSGSGATLGTSAPQEGAVVSNEGTSAEFSLDESQPTTYIQIRLCNGKRVKAKFNLSHTVADIHAYLKKEGESSSPYMLLAGFPPKPLKDQSATIEAAGLKMGQITQKSA